MVKLLRIQIIRTRIVHRLRVKHLQLDSLTDSLTAGRTMKYIQLSSGADSSESDNDIEVAEDVDEKMTSPAVKNERQSEDIKPADFSALPLSSKEEPLVQATLSSMIKKAEEKKRSIRSPKDLLQPKGQLRRSREQVQRKISQRGRKQVELGRNINQGGRR